MRLLLGQEGATLEGVPESVSWFLGYQGRVVAPAELRYLEEVVCQRILLREV